MSPVRCGFLNGLRDKYGLLRDTTDLAEAKKMALAALTDSDLRDRVKRGHRRLLQDSEDPLEFFLDIVDEYGRNGWPAMGGARG